MLLLMLLFLMLLLMMLVVDAVVSCDLTTSLLSAMGSVNIDAEAVTQIKTRINFRRPV